MTPSPPRPEEPGQPAPPADLPPGAAARARPSGRRQLLWRALGTVLGLVLLYAATRRVDPGTLVATFASIDWPWAAGVWVATAMFVVIKALRWRMLLGFVPGVPFRRLHASVYIGLAVNFVLAQAGEFFRAATFARENRLPVSTVFATVLVERALDFVALLLLLALISVLVDELPAYVHTALAVSGLVAAAGIAGLYTLLHMPEWLRATVRRLGRPLPEKIRGWCLNQFTLSRAGLIAIKDLRRMLFAVALSALQWFFVFGAIWASVRAVGEATEVVAVAATFVLIIVGQMLPNSPMQVGTTQLAFTIGLGAGGIMATEAIAASLMYTALLILPIMLVGGACLLEARRTGGRAW